MSVAVPVTSYQLPVTRHRLFLLALWVVLLPCAFWNPCAKADQLAPQADQVAMKTVTGTVVTVSKQAISVEYARTETSSYEMLLPVGEHVQLEHLKSLKDLVPGDTVRVQYEQTYRDGKDGEPIILKSLAREIALVKRSSGDHSLRSGESGAEGGVAR